MSANNTLHVKKIGLKEYQVEYKDKVNVLRFSENKQEYFLVLNDDALLDVIQPFIKKLIEQDRKVNI